MADHRIARVSPSTLYRDVQGEVVLLHLDSGEYFGLDDIGARIWHLIVEKGDLDAIEAVMREEYEVDPVQLSHDLKQILDDLVAKRLVNIESASS